VPLTSQQVLDDWIAGRHHELMRERLRPLLTAEVIAEHERQPFGQHSDALQRLHHYLGSFPIVGKLIVSYDGAEGWDVVRLVSAHGGLRTERVEGPFGTESAALHRIFELRIRDVFGAGPAGQEIAR
jgi:branched-chain amino acid transport system permease protein